MLKNFLVRERANRCILELKGKGYKKKFDDLLSALSKHIEQIQKDFVDPEKLQTTLRDGTLGDLKRALEMVAILEAQLKEMNPNLDSISEYAPVYIYMQTLSSLALVFALHHYKPTPLYVMDEIDAALGNSEKKKYHWASRISSADLMMKVVHNFENSRIFVMLSQLNSVESQNQSVFMEKPMAKYCQRVHPLIKKWYSGNSHSWNAMCKINRKIDHHILWKIGKGDVSFWYDNWSSLGPLYEYLSEGSKPGNY